VFESLDEAGAVLVVAKRHPKKSGGHVVDDELPVEAVAAVPELDEDALAVGMPLGTGEEALELAADGFRVGMTTASGAALAAGTELENGPEQR